MAATTDEHGISRTALLQPALRVEIEPAWRCSAAVRLALILVAWGIFRLRR